MPIDRYRKVCANPQATDPELARQLLDRSKELLGAVSRDRTVSAEISPKDLA